MKQRTKRRLWFGIAAASIVVGLAWLWIGVGGVGDAPRSATVSAVRSAKIEATTSAEERQAIATAARDAREAMRAKHPTAAPVLAKDMPALGLPSTATHLPTQAPPAEPMPTPRGSYPQ